MKRRSFLRGAVISLGAGVSAVPFASNAQAGPYRALVCLSLSGGNDSLNTFTPINDADSLRSYSRYVAVRGDLALTRGQGGLQQLQDSNLGVHPKLTQIGTSWAAGKLALIHNVGSIPQPVSIGQITQARMKDSSWIPEGLFSHSDQTYQWDTSLSTSDIYLGWGGNGAEQLLNNQVISFANNSRFGNSRSYKALVLPLPGSTFAMRTWATQFNPSARQAALEQLVTMSAPATIIEQKIKEQQLSSLSLSRSLTTTLGRAPGAAGSNPAIDAAFGNLQGLYATEISRQLYQVIKFLDPAGRSKLTGPKHIFYVRQEGFDHHGAQARSQEQLFLELNAALSAFTKSLELLGLEDNVTLFSSSEFGRTFRPNRSLGTDHAWGASHFVLGGAVKGKQEYGVYPNLVLGGSDDIEQYGASASNGRWLPTTSVSQYGATLLEWLSPGGNLNAVFPNLKNFPVKNLGFMKA